MPRHTNKLVLGERGGGVMQGPGERQLTSAGSSFQHCGARTGSWEKAQISHSCSLSLSLTWIININIDIKHVHCQNCLQIKQMKITTYWRKKQKEKVTQSTRTGEQILFSPHTRTAADKTTADKTCRCDWPILYFLPHSNFLYPSPNHMPMCQWCPPSSAAVSFS